VSIDLFVQVSVIAIMISAIYALIALGLSITFGVLGVVNFAHGEFYMLGSFGAYVLFRAFGAGYWWGFPLVILGGCLLGALIERSVFSPLRKDILGGLIASFGISFVLQQVVTAIMGPEDRVVPSLNLGGFRVSSISVPYDRLLLTAVSIIFMGIALVIIHQSKVGRAIRAVAQDMDAATLHGINVMWVRMVAMMLGLVLAVSAGFILASSSNINPYMGDDYILKAFIIVIVGGLGSIYGAIVGAVLLGFIDAFGMALIGVWSHLAGFVLLALVLLFRPYGIIGLVEREETK